MNCQVKTWLKNLKTVFIKICQNSKFPSIPGEPGSDYPIYAQIPPTSFSCQVLSIKYNLVKRIQCSKKNKNKLNKNSK